MAATLLVTWWMAAQQDEAASLSSRRMVVGGIEAFVERTKKMLLDYALWTDAYDNIRAGDLGWMYTNIGSSADIGTVDMAVILDPQGAGRLADRRRRRAGPADLLDPAALAAVNRQLDERRSTNGTAGTTYIALR